MEPGGPSIPEGEQVFDSFGCGVCHTLAAAGSSATTGPDLDEVLPGKSRAEIRESIVDPDAEITPGYSEGVMPSNYGDELSGGELESLIAFLLESVGG